MIVNPQVFNYRLAIGTLVVAVSVLATFSFTSYNDARMNEEFLKQEKKLLENQISEIISSYDKIGELNKSLVSELNIAKDKIESTNDSLQKLKTDVSLIHKYRDEMVVLKQQQNSLIKKGDSFFNANKELVKEKASISKNLSTQLSLVSDLKSEKNELKEELKNAALITANSFEAAAYEMKSSGEIVEIKKASNAKNIRVAFVIAKNTLAIKQNKELYIQVIGPDNNVVSDKGAVQFDESSLIYSGKVNVNYNNEVVEVCANIKTPEPLKEGRYYVSVFENNRRLGGTQIDLH